MAYSKQNWVDHDEDAVTGEVIVEGTPIDKLHLDHIEEGIAVAHIKADEVKGEFDTHTHTAADVCADPTGSATDALTNAKAYADTKVSTVTAALNAHTHTAADVGADPVGSAASALTSANNHTNAQISTVAAQVLTRATTATYTATVGTAASQNIGIAGIVATDNPMIDVVLSGNAATDLARLEAWGSVSRIVTYNGGITVVCYEQAPTVAIPIQIKVVR